MCGKDGLAGSPLSINTWASPSGKHYAPAGLTSTAMPSRIVRHVTHGPLQAAVRGFKPPATNNESCARLQLVPAPLLATRTLDLQTPAPVGRVVYPILVCFYRFPYSQQREVNLGGR